MIAVFGDSLTGTSSILQLSGCEPRQSEVSGISWLATSKIHKENYFRNKVQVDAFSGWGVSLGSILVTVLWEMLISSVSTDLRRKLRHLTQVKNLLLQLINPR